MLVKCRDMNLIRWWEFALCLFCLSFGGTCCVLSFLPVTLDDSFGFPGVWQKAGDNTLLILSAFTLKC